MSWTLRTFQTVTTCVIAGVWAAVFAVALVTADQLPTPDTAAVQLVLPPLLWVLAARFVLHHWWVTTGSRLAPMDPPERLLTAAVAALPERRREWGAAMAAELTEVEGRAERWRFALSSVRATLWLGAGGGRPGVVTLVAAAVVASTAAAGPLAGAAVPGLDVFAAAFTALVGALVVLAVARAGRPALPVPVPTFLVVAGVVAAIAVTVVFLRREPGAADRLPPLAAIHLAAVLAGCLGFALAPPRRLGTERPAPHLGATAGVLFAAWLLMVLRTDGAEPPLALLLVLTLALPLVPVAVFLLPAFVARRAGRSFRAGLLASLWTVVTAMPLTYALWLPEALRRYAIDGTLLVGGRGPVGTNLTDALVFTLGIFPVLGLTLGVIGAGLAARTARGPEAGGTGPGGTRPESPDPGGAGPWDSGPGPTNPARW
ncbi:hypothetical protein ACF09C_28265 [Streptomyces sp. NPDC014870]|uniref:hypothetical protein n=1 Tax=Streptomyces sp. NPDC014870 TaxID=3364925 RepID=UPI0036F75836